MRVYSKHKNSRRFALKIWDKKLNLYLKRNSIWMIFRYKIEIISDIEQKIRKLLVNIAVLPSWECGLKLKIFPAVLIVVWSLPSWECGLKFNCNSFILAINCRSLRGSVGWNPIFMHLTSFRFVAPFVGVWVEILKEQTKCIANDVAPFVGVWVEIFKMCPNRTIHERRSLRGSVGWNTWGVIALISHWVAPFVGVWVEMKETIAN